MATLALEAATYAGSVAVVEGDRVLAAFDVAMRGEREERLMPAVAAALAEAGVGVRELDRVVCGAGPGSFTSLRIAASIAKGIVTATGAPLHAVSSLLLLVAASDAPPGRYLAVLDAMRGDVFTAGWELLPETGLVELAPAALHRRAEVPALASRLHARPIGPAEELAAVPRALGVARLAGRLAHGSPVDLASWEPMYGRVAEAQARWERAHGRPLATG